MRHTRLAAALAAIALVTAASHGSAAGDAPDSRPCLRVGVAARVSPEGVLTPLLYSGGFRTKTACYEGLTAFGPRGELAPALATSWEVSEDGRTILLRLREGVVAHDGRRLDAASVRNHLLRWRGNYANSWIGSTLRMDRIEAVDDLTVRVTLSEAWPFLEECAAAINPAYIVARGSYTNEGVFVRATGSGPFALEAVGPAGVLAFRAHERHWRGVPALPRVEMVPLPDGFAESPTALELLRQGKADLVADGSSPILPREGLAALTAGGAFRVWRARGTAVTLLRLNTLAGPMADVELRRRLAACLDRAALVAEGELSYAVPATTLFAPGLGGWPESGRTAAPQAARGEERALEFVLPAGAPPRLRRGAEAVARQAEKAGLRVKVVVPASPEEAADRETRGAWDVQFETTYGAPYDPWISLQTLFLDRPAGETASSRPPRWRDEAVRTALLAGFTTPKPEARAAAFRLIQARLDEEVPLVPLFISDRLAVTNDLVTELPLDGNGYDLRLSEVRTRPLPARPSLLAPPAAAPLPPPAPGADPRSGEVRLPAEPGWNASLVLENEGVGVWVLGCFHVFPDYGSPEVIGLDDRGRMAVLVPYSGRWTPVRVIEEGVWLNALAHADVDPRIDGEETYVGGQAGNLYQVVAHRNRRLDYRLIATFPGLEVNVAVAADLRPDSPGREILVFTNPGTAHLVTPTGADGKFESRPLGDVPGLVREAVWLPGPPGAPPRLACVSRAGWLRIATLTDGGLQWQEVCREETGLGRIALRPAREGEGLVLYSTADDGRILRHEAQADGTFRTETIYLGPTGPRGVAAGRFDEDPATETVAVYGYGKAVELLVRRDGRWRAETVFVERDKGHALIAAELDGRNGTDELVLAGFGARIVLLARPPGYARPETAVK